MRDSRLISLAIGKPKENQWNDHLEISGIGKTGVTDAVLKKASFVGDDVANHEFHGGADRAVCLYPFEHYSLWEKTFNKKILPPAFGENITAEGMREEEVCIGDIYKVGGTVLQVSQGRVPCSTISKFNKEETFLNQVFETCFTGYFFRVLEEGTITIDSKIELMEEHPKKISILFASQTLFHHPEDKKAIEDILTIEELADDWKKRFLKLL